MGKVRGVSLRGSNFRCRARYAVLFSDFPWTSYFTHFHCLPLDMSNVASDQLEWTQLQMYASDVDLNIRCHPSPSYSATSVTIMYVLNRLCEQSTNFHQYASGTWMMVNKWYDDADDYIVFLITMRAINYPTGVCHHKCTIGVCLLPSI